MPTYAETHDTRKAVANDVGRQHTIIAAGPYQPSVFSCQYYPHSFFGPLANLPGISLVFTEN